MHPAAPSRCPPALTSGAGAQNIFYAGFGFTNWPNDVCNDLVLQKDGKCRFVCAEDNYRKAVTYFHDWYAEGSDGRGDVQSGCQPAAG